MEKEPMGRPRLGIAAIMIIIAMVAIDLAARRALFDFKEQIRIGAQPLEATRTVNYLMIGGLPMVHILLIDLLIGYHRRRSRAAALGFAAFGAIALATYVAITLYWIEAFALYAVVVSPCVETIRALFPSHRLAASYLAGGTFLVLPQFAFALLGGFLARARWGEDRRASEERGEASVQGP
jgi:hypothetical protein